MVLFAALTSAVSILEACVTSVIDRFHWSRRRSVCILAALGALFSFLVCRGYNDLYFEYTLPNGAVGQILDIFDYVSNNVFYLQLFGSILLLIFGIHTFRSNPVKALRAPSGKKGSYMHNFLTAFLVTLSNPLIILLFIGLFARFSFVSEGMLVSETVTGYVAIVAGALLWWFLLSTGVSKVRTQFNLRGIWIINRTIGVIVIIVAVVGLIITFLGESLY